MKVSTNGLAEERWSFDDCIMQTIGEFREEIKDKISEGEIEDITKFDASDMIHEIADNNVPIMNWDILNYAVRKFDLAVKEPEIYAFNGEHTAINAIAGNMYEALAEALYNELDNIITKEVL